MQMSSMNSVPLEFFPELTPEIQKQIDCARKLGDVTAETPYLETHFKDWGTMSVQKLPPDGATYGALYQVESEACGTFYFGFNGGLTWFCDDGLNAIVLEFTDENDATTVLSVRDTHSQQEFKGITMAVVDIVEEMLKDIQY